MKEIANQHDQEVLKALSIIHECFRKLMGAGLTFEDLQKMIDDPKLRHAVVNFWQNPGKAKKDVPFVVESYLEDAESLANPSCNELLKALGRIMECMRRLIGAGLTFEDIQESIESAKLRKIIVFYWQNPDIALGRDILIFPERHPENYVEWLELPKEYFVAGSWIESWTGSKVDLNKVLLSTGTDFTKKSGTTLEERRMYVENHDGHHYDERLFFQLWHNLERMPESFKGKDPNKPLKVLFAATRFGKKNDKGDIERFALFVSFVGGQWTRGLEKLDNISDEEIVFAVRSFSK